MLRVKVESMKKYIVIALAMVAQLCLANVVTGVAAIPDGYYDGVNNLRSNYPLHRLYDQLQRGHRY